MLQRTFPPLGAKSAAVLALGNVPRWVSWLLGGRVTVTWKRMAGMTRVSSWYLAGVGGVFRMSRCPTRNWPLAPGGSRTSGQSHRGILLPGSEAGLSGVSTDLESEVYFCVHV